ncbi:MAG: zinc ribbon domain-containing protein [Acidobacteriota bacterium]
MHCPNCGQSALREARYCSRCGLPLTAVSELLSNGGFPVEAKAKPRRSQGMRAGAKLMFLSAVLLPIFFGFCFPADSPAPLLVPLTVFLMGLSCLVYFRLFGDEEPRENRNQAHRFERERAALQQSDRAALFIDRQTGDIDQPSVTERTTHLFDQ